MRYQKHFMIDIETWANGPYAMIVSFAAVLFDPNKQDIDVNETEPDPNHSFYVTIDPVEAEKIGMRMEAATISWWLDPERRQAWDAWRRPLHFSPMNGFEGFGMWLDEVVDKNDPPDIPARDVLEKMSEENAYRETIKHRVMWGNGPGFDNERMKEAYKLLRMRCPWPYSNDRCFRTFKNLPRAHECRPPDVGTHHNALSDALYQARWLQNIVKEYDLTL